MNRPSLCQLLGVVFCCCIAFPGAAADKPNIIIVVADDLSATELGSYGNKEHRTPNLDRMAAEGLRLDTFYVTPLCTPTRVALMTGQYGFHNGYLGMKYEEFKPAPESPMRDIGNHFTNADLLRSAGYATAMVGKWQLTGEFPTLIRDCGFAEYRMWAYEHNLPQGVKHSGRWETSGQSNPARFWHPSIVENGKYMPTKPDDYGPDLMHEFVVDFMRRHKAQPFFIYYSSLLTHNPYEETPDPQRPGRRWPAGYKSNVEYLDYLMGRLVKALREEGLSRKTVVLFLSDNGTARSGKGTLTETGVRAPFIAWGPGLVKPAPGAQRGLSDVTDLLPTLAELAGAKLPRGRPFDGKSLAPLLRGETTRHREWIYSFLDDGRILRDDRWLLEIPEGGAPERMYDCGTSRDGTGCRAVGGTKSAAAKAARERFAGILRTMPDPPRRRVSSGTEVDPKTRQGTGAEDGED